MAKLTDIGPTYENPCRENLHDIMFIQQKIMQIGDQNIVLGILL